MSIIGPALGVITQVVVAPFKLARNGMLLNAGKAIPQHTTKMLERAPLACAIESLGTTHLLEPGIAGIHAAGAELRGGTIKKLFSAEGLDIITGIGSKLTGRGALICAVLGLASLAGGKLAYDTITENGRKIVDVRHGQLVDGSNSEGFYQAKMAMGTLQAIGCAMTISLFPPLIPLGIATAATGAAGNLALGVIKHFKCGINVINNPDVSNIPYLSDVVKFMTGKTH